MSDRFFGFRKNKLLIIIMILIGIALIFDAAIRTLKNANHFPFLVISIVGFVILVLIYWFKGKDW